MRYYCVTFFLKHKRNEGLFQSFFKSWAVLIFVALLFDSVTVLSNVSSLSAIRKAQETTVPNVTLIYTSGF